MWDHAGNFSSPMGISKLLRKNPEDLHHRIPIVDEDDWRVVEGEDSKTGEDGERRGPYTDAAFDAIGR
jgi:hypothetical protein